MAEGAAESDENSHLAFRVAYDGRRFHGFQRQPDVATVEDTLFSAIDALGIGDDREEPPAGYAAAGRTDAGVSALAQTVAFRAPDWVTPTALNGELPTDVRIWARTPVPDPFHPRYDATDRTYVYFLPAAGMDLRRARAVCAAVEGTHEFANLTSDSANTVRSLRDVSLQAIGPFLRLSVRAAGFLREQVRRLATLVRTVGTGERSPAAVDRVLSSEPLDGPAGIAPSPPEYLVLTDVTYPEQTFQADHETRTAVHDAFADKRRHHAAVSRVMGAIGAGVGGSATHPGVDPD